MPKKVFISGCFDLLHSGHIAFFQEAALFGDLYVALGSDSTVNQLKGRPPLNSEEERLFMVQSISSVKEAFVSQGSGILDFVKELGVIKPDIFVVNEDGNIPAKRKLCEDFEIEYVILQRKPYPGLAPRSSTDLKKIDRMPYRIDLAGGWLDQPFVSIHHPGAVITVSIEPTISFSERSGMASSTRHTAIELWGARLPVGDPEKLANILFCCDNPPGTQVISGSQDAIGIVCPGLNKSTYHGQYWPTSIETNHDKSVLRFIEDALYLVPLGPRLPDFDVLKDTKINRDRAAALADATERCWQAILDRDIHGFGTYFRRSFDAQVAMFPGMRNDLLDRLIESYRDKALGWKVSGAGGGGYLILVADTPVKHAIQISVRRSDHE